MLSDHAQITKNEYEQKVYILESKKKHRILTHMRHYKNKQLSLKLRYDTLKEATDKRIKYRFILQWIRQYDIEWSIKELRDKRETKLKSA